MRNLKPSKNPPFDFHKDIVNSVKNLDSQKRLITQESNIEALYDLFITNQEENNLATTLAFNYKGLEKDDLLGLYNYRKSIIQELKKEITTTDDGRLISTCQNCTLNKINSFDHILPKDEFSEFSVNPLNLFPSCTECNSYKGKYWQKDGKPYFLNLYIDILPNLQYLYVDIDLKTVTPKAKLSLKNNGINPILFSIIKTHYDRLHLFDRFSDSLDDVITPLICLVKNYLEELDFPSIQRLVIKTQSESQLKYGFNHWEVIVTLELINHPDFLKLVNAN